MDTAIGRYASSVGMDKNLATGKVAIALTELSKQAAALAAEKGIDFQSFNIWMRTHYSETAAGIIMNHLKTGNVRSVWSPMMDRFAISGGKNR
jgi:hypothetical protein